MVKGQLITYKDELKWQNLAEKELGKAMVLPQEEKDVLASQDINNQEFFDLPHKCKECGAQYMSESELENHLILRIWCCLKCNQTFKYKESWTRHMQEALHVDVFTDDAKAKTEAEAEAKAKAEAEAKALAEAEALAKAVAEEKAKAEAEEKAKIEAEATALEKARIEALLAVKLVANSQPFFPNLAYTSHFTYLPLFSIILIFFS